MTRRLTRLVGLRRRHCVCVDSGGFGYGWTSSVNPTAARATKDSSIRHCPGNIGVIDVHTSTVLVDFYQYLEAQLGPDFLTDWPPRSPRSTRVVYRWPKR